MELLNKISEAINNNEIEKAYELLINNEEECIKNSEYWNLRGILCVKCNEYLSSITCFQKAIELKSEVFDYYYNLAFAYENIGCNSEAALYYGRAYKMSDDELIKKDIKNIFVKEDSLKNIFMVASSNKKRTFILLSSCGWSEAQQRMHHIAKSLVKFGNTVYYIAPIATINNGNLREKDLIDLSINESKIVEGVVVLQPYSINQGQKIIYNSYTDLVQTVLDDFAANGDTVILTYMPYQVQTIKRLNGDFLHIYDCVDDHTDLVNSFWGEKSDVVLEQELMDYADAITTTSITLLLKRCALEERKNVFLSRNGVNEKDFLLEENYECPLDLKDIPKPRIVYSGYIYDRFDFDLFNEVMLANPDKSFVVIGGIKEGLIKEIPKNLYLLGFKKHSELKKYLSHMNIGINPLKYDADMVLCCDSIKNYEFSACGLPVIVTPIPDVMIDKEYTYIANDAKEFNLAIDECLSLQIDKELLNRFLSENSWNEKAALLCKVSDNRYIQELSRKSVESTGQKITEAYKKYPNSTMSILYAMYNGINDNQKFESLAREAFIKTGISFAFKVYLKALLKNNNMVELKQKLEDSLNLRKELRDELKFRGNNELFIKIITAITINEFTEGIKLINELNSSDKQVFESYINFLLGKEVNTSKLEKIKICEKSSPLYKFLIKNSVNKGKEYYLVNNYDTELRDVFELLKNDNIEIDKVVQFTNRIESHTKERELQEIIQKIKNGEGRLIVFFNNDYVSQIRVLAKMGFTECIVAIIFRNKLEYVRIDSNLFKQIKEEKYLETISINQYDNSDSNIYAMLKYIPNELKNKYKINLIKGMDVWSAQNIVKVPLISSITMSGFATFLYNPKFTYNIELWHGSLALKGCGLMDVKEKNSGGGTELWSKVDKICIPSDFSKVIFSACYAIPEDKYIVAGDPRTDLLMNSNGKKNIEKILKIKLNNKKVILNMPTFHKFVEMDRIEGSNDFTGPIKILDFDYDEFDEFLEENSAILITKVHHVEENHVSYKKKYKNIYTITSADLDDKDINLYEIINGAHMLITDYSSVYGDFLFMNKPILFTNSDIEEYRKSRGLLLEPYDYWTAGPKVKIQANFESEIKKYLEDEDYYKVERERFRELFYKNIDSNSSYRMWEYIDRKFNELKIKKEKE